MSQPTTETYVRYFHPGAFVSEESSRRISERDSIVAARNAPASAFAFEFYDVIVTEAESGGRAVPLRSGELHKSARFYIDAECLDAAAVAALPGDHRILLSNMSGNGWISVVRTRAGNFQPFAIGDELVSADA
jgi:hypothetical protein